MKKIIITISSFFLIFTALFLGIFNITKADVIQDINGTYTTDGDGWQQVLGTGLSGELTSFKVGTDEANGTANDMYLYECSDEITTDNVGSYYSFCSNLSAVYNVLGGGPVSASNGFFVASGATHWTFDESKYYLIVFSVGGSLRSLSGTTDDVYDNGWATRRPQGSGSLNSILDFKFELIGVNGASINSITPYTPSTTSTTTYTDFPVYFNGTTTQSIDGYYDQIKLRIGSTDTSTAWYTLYYTFPISTTTDYNFELNGIRNGNYIATYYFKNSSSSASSLYMTGPNDFIVNIPDNPVISTSTIPLSLQPIDATSTPDCEGSIACYVKVALIEGLSYVFIPTTAGIADNLQRMQIVASDTFPFKYFWDIGIAFQNISVSESSTTPEIALPFQIGNASTSLPLLSFNSMSSIIDSDIYNSIYDIIKWSIWVMFIIYLVDLRKRIIPF